MESLEFGGSFLELNTAIVADGSMDHGWRRGVRWKEGEETWAGCGCTFLLFCPGTGEKR